MLTIPKLAGVYKTALSLRTVRGGCSRSLSSAAEGGSPKEDTVVQYVVVRRDLVQQGWGTGPLMAQACHAATAAVWLSKDEPYTKQYAGGWCDWASFRNVLLTKSGDVCVCVVCACVRARARMGVDLDHMHKVILSAKNEGALLKAAKALEQGGVGYKLWVEQPENIPTALATYPRPRSEIQPCTKNLQLFRD
eukprot:CAMPEP_0170199832 /NCGR_PEP_ID=MMETSP0040_2-20121228/69550_1 /TAXON_ID=641309 /ORGANISM="Lotharella oceanica, Strain CCMP622" /LENGTH=192 /DNA_ID=CAMNT_0010449983 /DNA_START=103 /DNA_END=681 /DNA_ORIENTATION=+